MISIRGLKKRLGGKPVLDGIDLDVEKGETVVVAGPSGVGKSVLLKHVIGLMMPDEGSILVDGEEVVGKSERELYPLREKFGMLFQGAALFDSLTVAENVALPLREHLNLTEDEIMARVSERLDWVGLESVEESLPASLSGGMRKRVGLARAIVLDPEIILYDEPNTGLDPIMAKAIDDLIRGLQKRLGVTSMVVTHDMASAFEVGDRIAMLLGGKVVYIGTPGEMRDSQHPVVRQFIERSGEGPVRPI